jgi:hypothetical protein
VTDYEVNSLIGRLVSQLVKVKLSPSQAVEAYRVVRCVRSPHCLDLDSRLTGGGKAVSPTQRPHFTPQKHYSYASGTHFR